MQPGELIAMLRKLYHKATQSKIIDMFLVLDMFEN